MSQSGLKFAVLLAVSLAWPGAATPQSPSPEALAAAKDFMIASKMADQMKQMLTVLPEALRPPGDPAATRNYDLIAPVITNALKSYVDTYVDEAAEIYARHLTADELRQFANFYRTPAGEKFLQKQPELARELATAMQKLSPMMEEIKKNLAEELRKRGRSP